MSTARWIDAIMGVLFIAFGVWGLFPAAAGMVLGVFPVTVPMGSLAILAGAVLLSGIVSTSTAKTVAGSVGIILALVGAVSLFSDLFGLVPSSGWNSGLLLGSAALLLYDWLGTPDDASTVGRTPVR
ncbi:hypothetical protein [Deinococcus yunweiensis]|uniref:hypothetical protein n=1 Tax=Deinococcus yunweiensis TaxID=367282 RepID=UPI00398F1402